MLDTIPYTRDTYNNCLESASGDLFSYSKLDEAVISSVDFLSYIPRDESIAFPDLVDVIQLDHPGVPGDLIRSVLLDVIGDLNWDWDYTLGENGDYVISHSLKSLSLLDRSIDLGEMAGHIQYPAIMPDRIQTDHDHPRTYDRSGAWVFAHHMNGRFAFTVAGGAAFSLTDHCGHISKAGACQSNRSKGVVSSHLWCGDTLCPTCWGARTERTKEKIVNRLIGGVGAWRLVGRDLGPIQDASFHPPQDLWDLATTAEGCRSLRTKLYKALTLAGVTGAAVVFHPFRTTPQAKAAFRVAKKRGFKNAKGGIWSWLRDMNYLGPDAGMVVFSPHYHILFTGWLKRSDLFFKASGGWTYKKTKRHGSVVSWPVSGQSCKNQADLEKKIFYVLSHVGVLWDLKEKKRPLDNVTWFGVFSTHSIKITSQATLKEEVVIDGDPVVEYDGFDAVLLDGSWVPVLSDAYPTDRLWVEYTLVRTYAVRDPDAWVGLGDPGGPGDPGK